MMLKLIPQLLIAPLLLAAGFAYPATADECHGPAAPSEFPEPSTATPEEILASQEAVKKYLSEMEAALKCMDAQHNDRARNVAVDDMQRMAARFNTILRAFRARQKS